MITYTTVNEDGEEVKTGFKSQAVAVEHAIADQRAAGGGVVWVHRGSCKGDEVDNDADCACDPVSIVVDGADA